MESGILKLLSALAGGAIMTILTMVPYLGYINVACCVGIMLGGFAAVTIYSRQFPVDTKSGAIVGLFSGIVGGVLMSIVHVIQALATKSGAELLALLNLLGVSLAGKVILLIIPVIVYILLALVFGLLGGLIAGAIFKSSSGTGKKK